MKLHRLTSDCVEAIAFLTRLPLPACLFPNSPAGAKAAWAFPLAGIIATLPSALVLIVILPLGANPYLAGFAAIGLSVLFTGALHEDGLADSADGLMVMRDREKSLAIMKDSANGTFATLALVLSVTLRATALASVAASVSALAAALLLLGIAALSRAAMVCHWHALHAARRDGAAASLGRPGFSTMLAAFLIGLAAFVLTSTISGTMPGALGGIAIALAAVFMFTLRCHRQIDGHTGDTIGASEQIAEIALLAGLALFS
ncbi:adenosylcobinamide-GDP ribazoletransferase [Martelella alba]|uniref:Adenosylcobinamide-GDP ribazoletransferase n=1 Tax=Martelella alba TaxID=2590451 RepID=A0A506U9W4_9HYPH|nr:adenosylcobinamide-GDP ribazoletransferase [Martelella alba]TPW29379.1 adenosylcobinamide-GDP ribazoletransferase [Martelella alba]